MIFGCLEKAIAINATVVFLYIGFQLSKNEFLIDPIVVFLGIGCRVYEKA